MEVNTTKLSNSGIDLKNLSREFKEEIDVLFAKIANLKKSGIWIGGAADEFIRKSQIDKIEYIKVQETLLKYGNLLTTAANKYDDSVKKLGG